MNDHTRILAAALLAAEHSISITHHTDTVTAEALRAGTLWWSTAPVHANRAIATQRPSLTCVINSPFLVQPQRLQHYLHYEAKPCYNKPISFNNS